jgi:hypothetical protein
MATLTEVSIISRKVIRYGIYLIILIIIARSGFNIGKTIYLKVFPPPPTPPNACFGPLGTLPLMQNKPESSLNYVLETPEGSLPTFGEKMNVYFMPQYLAGISNEDVAKSKARALGFDPNGKKLHENIQNVYLFQKPSEPSTLTMNIINGIFSISYDVYAKPTAVVGTPLSAELAISKVQSILTAANLNHPDLTGAIKTEYIKYDNGQYKVADSLSDANLIKVNIFRKLFEDKYPSMTPDPNQGNIWMLLNGDTNGNIIAGEYRYFPVDESKVCPDGSAATYPIKTAQQAWDELISGKGYIANLGSVKGGEVKIRKVYLAYFDAGQYVEFYQPIIVFEGVDNGFVAYVPAVTDDYYKSTPTPGQ